MEIVFIVMAVQIALGGFNNFYHHELTEKLPSKPESRHELTFHFMRELIYAVLFFGLAWYEWHGIWAVILMGLFATKLVVTMCDFVIADKTRIVPAFERVLHSILAINIGVFLTLLYPIAVKWYGHETALYSVDYGYWSWFFTACAFVVGAWGLRNVFAVMKLHILKVPEWQRKPFKNGHNKNPKTYLITGATGFIGNALVRKLIWQGNEIIALSRDIKKVNYKFGPHAIAIDDLEQIQNSKKIDIIINLAGEALAGGLWTKKRKQKFFDSRLNTTIDLVTLIARLETKPELLLNGSAIGFYGNRHDEIMTENSDCKTDFMSELCQKWEDQAKKAEEYGLRVAILRTGLVLDGNGGILTPILLSAKLGGGMVMGSGKQYMSWIDLHDIIRLMQFIVSNKNLNGAINATAPKPVSQKEFMKTLGRSLKRPVFMRLPAWVFRMFLKDMADLFLNGQRVLPKKAQDNGFEFSYPDLKDSFERITSKEVNNIEGKSEVFYNSDCSICDIEMNHYCELKKESGALIDFKSINSNSEALTEYGLREKDIKKRLYVLKSNGEVANGVDANIEIWSHFPRYKKYAKFLKFGPIHFIASFVYEGIIVPKLAYDNAKLSKKLIASKYKSNDNI
jgi:uncharacterized protein (TIGR01777 family)